MTKVSPSSIKYAAGTFQREFPSLTASQAIELAVKVKQVEVLEEISESIKSIAISQKGSK